MADRSLDLLRNLVELESPSGAVPELAALRDVLVEEFRGVGADVRVEPGAAGDHLVADVGRFDGRPHTLVLGHYDTVWPVGRLADSPFTVDGDRITGPGVFDMKAGLVALRDALDGLDPDALTRPVRIVLTADEEVGSPDGRRVVEAGADGAAEVFALEPPLADGVLKVGRRGVARVLVRVEGREAHAGLDLASGVSATSELVDQLARLDREFPASDALSVNVGRIAGGTRANVVAGRAEAELGLRFAAPEDEQRLLGALRELAPVRPGAQVTTELLSHRPAWEPSQSRALAAEVLAVLAELGEHVGTAVSGGAGDANLTGGRGIPTVDGLGPRGRGAHAVTEALELSSLPVRTELLRRLLTRPLRG